MSTLLNPRLAGVLYLLIIIFGITSEFMLRGTLIVSGDVSVTTANILAQTVIFKSSFILDLLMILADILVAIIFYHLFKSINQTVSMTAMVFRLIQAMVLIVNTLVLYAAYLVLTTPEFGFGINNRESLSYLFIVVHSYGYDLGLIFFAFSNLAIGIILLTLEGKLRVLGVGLFIAALVYLIGSLLRFINTEWNEAFQLFYLISFIVELVFAMWLLTRPKDFVFKKFATTTM